MRVNLTGANLRDTNFTAAKNLDKLASPCLAFGLVGDEKRTGYLVQGDRLYIDFADIYGPVKSIRKVIRGKYGNDSQYEAKLDQAIKDFYKKYPEVKNESILS